ncbi:hypothetical protein RA269_28195, partial [Pseudomonas syringae pv. tagetis]|uniref:hypothetical protein n=1 Tax=Pseudomonas syringae group genomosp. 7 TaxID=251699 RepID=UPI00376F70C2
MVVLGFGVGAGLCGWGDGVGEVLVWVLRSGGLVLFGGEGFLWVGGGFGCAMALSAVVTGLFQAYDGRLYSIG